MSEVIKKIGTSEIRVRRVEIEQHTVILFVLAFIIGTVAAGIYYMQKAGSDVVASITLAFMVGMAVMVMTAIIIVVILAAFDKHSTPGYEVYVNSETGIFITATTPEADQIAICNAAKQLETRATNLYVQDTLLKNFAENCK